MCNLAKNLRTVTLFNDKYYKKKKTDIFNLSTVTLESKSIKNILKNIQILKQNLNN